MFDIAAVGHLCIDSIFLPERTSPCVVLGGSAAYVSLTARRLESTVAIVSKVGADFPEAYRWWLAQERIDLSALSRLGEAQTTRFTLKYNNDLTERTLQLTAKAPPITLEDLANSLKAGAVHLAPIAGEVTYEVIDHMRKCTETVSLDPQGLLRDFDKEGNVSLGKLTNVRLLELVDIYKSSQLEIEALTGGSELNKAIKAVHDYGVDVVIVTLGRKGAVVSAEDTVYNVPACEPTKTVDPTGAGDAFIGGFLSEYVNGANIFRCACVGSAAASFAVEGVGPTSLADKAQIYQRARELYEKEIRQDAHHIS
ncbi:MAG: PfkB family carbohydrate kinase [Candidatus Bathyarchaeia archaeon]